MNYEFEQVWLGFSTLIDDAKPKELAELFYMKGLVDGKETVLREIRPLVTRLTPDEAMKVEAATVSEHVNYRLLGEVIEAKKHSN